MPRLAAVRMFQFPVAPPAVDGELYLVGCSVKDLTGSNEQRIDEVPTRDGRRCEALHPQRELIPHRQDPSLLLRQLQEEVLPLPDHVRGHRRRLPPEQQSKW